MQFKPGLYLVATPIGNLGDISQRAIETFNNAEVICCEDTREIKKLLQLLSVDYENKKFYAVHDHNEFDLAAKVIESAKTQVVVYCSDAGTPAISDPGAILVDKAHEEKIYLTLIPGPSAVVSAYALSGFSSKEFSFIGFLPKAPGQKNEVLKSFASNKRPIVFYESPNRLVTTLQSIEQSIPNRQVVVARELTKKFEEVFRGTASEVAQHFKEAPKGEVVVVIDVAEQTAENNDALMRAMKLLKEKGLTSKDAIEILTPITKRSKNELKQIFQDV